MGIRQVDLGELDKSKEEGEKEKPQSERDKRKSAQGERNLTARLTECFDRIAEALEQRGDDELAGIIREDAQVMAGGIMSLTRPFKPIRSVVLLGIAVVEPVLAFGRIARVAAIRWSERRAAAEAERRMAEQPEQPPFVT